MSSSVQAALKRIEAGIEAVRDSERFREYLAFCGRFHKYSFANRILIWSQRPTATLVAGFGTWLTLKRHVRKGEKGIMILAPMTGKLKAAAQREDAASSDAEPQEPANEEITYRYFRPVYVFDLSQTEGEELPSLAQKLAGNDAGIFALLAKVAKSEGLTIDREPGQHQTANGFYVKSEGRIWVSPALEPLQAAKTLAHELSHHFADHQAKGHGRAEAEMIAESSAFIVMAHLGQDAGDYSFGYLASWGDTKVLKQRLQDIRETSEAIHFEAHAHSDVPLVLVCWAFLGSCRAKVPIVNLRAFGSSSKRWLLPPFPQGSRGLAEK